MAHGHIYIYIYICVHNTSLRANVKRLSLELGLHLGARARLFIDSVLLARNAWKACITTHTYIHIYIREENITYMYVYIYIYVYIHIYIHT